MAAGLSGVLLALHLAYLNFGPGRIGATVSLGLAGIALGSLVAFRNADRAGRRRTLVVVAVLLAVGGACFALASRDGILIAAACIGMVNGMGRDRGPGLTVDQAILPQTVAPARRTWVKATAGPSRRLSRKGRSGPGTSAVSRPAYC